MADVLVDGCASCPFLTMDSDGEHRCNLAERGGKDQPQIPYEKGGEDVALSVPNDCPLWAASAHVLLARSRQPRQYDDKD